MLRDQREEGFTKGWAQGRNGLKIDITDGLKVHSQKLNKSRCVCGDHAKGNSTRPTHALAASETVSLAILVGFFYKFLGTVSYSLYLFL